MDSAVFASLAAKRALSSRLPEFCSSAHLLCFPAEDSLAAANRKGSPSRFSTYVEQNFTGYREAYSFDNYSASDRLQLDSFRRYSRGSTAHGEEFSKYAPNANGYTQSFNTYGAGANKGTSEFRSYSKGSNVPTLRFASYSDRAEGRRQTSSATARR